MTTHDKILIIITVTAAVAIAASLIAIRWYAEQLAGV